MVKNIINRISYFFLKKGIVLEIHKLPKPNEFKKEISKYNREIQKYLIKNYTRKIHSISNHGLYNEFLISFFNDWHLKNSKVKFLNVYGGGKENLNIYRKVEFEGQSLFEKTYNEREDSVDFFYSNIYLILSKYFNIPKLVYHFKSENLALFYTEYHNLNYFNKYSEYVDSVLDVVKKMIDISASNEMVVLKDNILCYGNSFIDHEVYLDFRSVVDENLQKHSINLNDLEKNLITQSFVISHGDLNRHNVYKGSVIIDWDKYGLNPIGYDLGRIAAYFIQDGYYHFDYNKWITENYENRLQKIELQKLRRNFLFFYYIFCHAMYINIGFDMSKHLDNLLEDLSESIKLAQ